VDLLLQAFEIAQHILSGQRFVLAEALVLRVFQHGTKLFTAPQPSTDLLVVFNDLTHVVWDGFCKFGFQILSLYAEKVIDLVHGSRGVCEVVLVRDAKHALPWQLFGESPHLNVCVVGVMHQVGEEEDIVDSEPADFRIDFTVLLPILGWNSLHGISSLKCPDGVEPNCLF